MKHFTEVEIFLDPSTFLPVSYVYNLHPDNNALVDIPIEIRYSNYQSVAGLQIPLHVQKFINNTLAMDAQFQNASPISALPLRRSPRNEPAKENKLMIRQDSFSLHAHSHLASWQWPECSGTDWAHRLSALSAGILKFSTSPT